MAGVAANHTGLCLCGCGQPTRRSPQTHRASGYDKGDHYQFIQGHSHRGTMPTSPKTYVTRSALHKPHGFEYEHILLAEAALGKALPAGAQVHHVDGNRHNNTRSNLVICQDSSYHQLLHRRQKVLAAGGDPNSQKMCSFCQKPEPFANFNRLSSNKGDGLQSACRVSMGNHRKRWKAASA